MDNLTPAETNLLLRKGMSLFEIKAYDMSLTTERIELKRIWII